MVREKAFVQGRVRRVLYAKWHQKSHKSQSSVSAKCLRDSRQNFPLNGRRTGLKTYCRSRCCWKDFRLAAYLQWEDNLNTTFHVWFAQQCAGFSLYSGATLFNFIAQSLRVIFCWPVTLIHRLLFAFQSLQRAQRSEIGCEQPYLLQGVGERSNVHLKYRPPPPPPPPHPLPKKKNALMYLSVSKCLLQNSILIYGGGCHGYEARGNFLRNQQRHIFYILTYSPSILN